MRPRTTSALSVCRSQFRFHSYRVVVVGLLVLAGFLSPARSQEEAVDHPSGFELESTSGPQESLEGPLSESVDGGRFELLGSMGGYGGPIALQRGYAYVGFGQTLTVLDASNPAKLKCTKRIPRPRTVSAITATEDLLIVGDESGELCVYSLVNPATPVWLNQEHPLSLGGPVHFTSFFVQGDSLYAYWGGSLHVVDLTDPSFPKLTGSCVVSGLPKTSHVNCQDIWVQGDYAFLVNRELGSLVVVDLHQGASPILVATKVLEPSYNRLYAIQVQGEMLYGLGRNDYGLSLFCIDISNPLLPELLGSVFLAVGCSGVRDFGIRGNRIFVTGQDLHVVDVLDPTEPLKYMIDDFDLDIQYGRSAFGGNTLFVTSNQTGEILSFDWTRVGDPEKIGTYRGEPYHIESLAVQEKTLFMSSDGMWILDVSEPEDLTTLYRRTYRSNPRPLGNGLMLAIYADTKSAIYDISDPTSPTVLSTFDVILSGDVVYEKPYLYGVSTTTGLTVVDLQDPFEPVVVFSASPSGRESWAKGVFKTGNFLCVHRNSSGDCLFVHDVTQPVKPILASSRITNQNCGEMRGVGRSLYLAGRMPYPASSALLGYDLTDPLHPRKVLQIPIEDSPTALEVSGGLAYIATETPRFKVFDITAPSTPRELLTAGIGPGSGTISEVVASDSLLYVAEDGGLSIYRHILPATPTEVTFSCAGLVQQDNRELHLKIFAGEPPDGNCNSATVISATPLVDCRLGCPYITSEGAVPCDETPFRLLSTVDCEQAVSTWLDTVVAAINEQAGDMLRVTRTSPNSISLGSIQPFYGALCGQELGVSCEGQSNRILHDCSINNLMDGVDGNENAVETGGFGIAWQKYVVPVEPTATPTAIPSDTPIPTPTYTKTITDTRAPTNTRTPYPTATRTDIFVDPSGSEFVKIGALGGSLGAVATDGRYAYVASGRNMEVLDAVDPANPAFVKQLFQKHVISAAIVSGNLLVVGDVKGYVNIYSLDSPADPTLLNKNRTLRACKELT